MNRWLRLALAIALIAGMVGVTQAQDVVRYFDRTKKKEDSYRGTIEEESPGGIKIKVKDGKMLVVKQVSTGDIIEVTYHTADVDKLTFRGPFVKEDKARRETRPVQRAKLIGEAIAGYQNLEGLLKGKPNARRYILFKIAEMAVLQAQDDPSKADTAIKLLTDFKKEHNGGWEILSALKMLAKLQEEAGKTDDARKTYEELAEVPDVPRELKQESEILVGRLLLRGSKFADAQKRLEKLKGTMSGADAQKPFVEAYLAESLIGQNKLDGVEKQLKEAISSSTDNRLRGAAYNLLGDYYRKKNKLQDAFWSYLRVDTMYNEDAEEQAKALYHLSSLFDSEKKDPIRGKECANRLRDKRFAGTVYQKLLKPADKK